MTLQRPGVQLTERAPKDGPTGETVVGQPTRVQAAPDVPAIHGLHHKSGPAPDKRCEVGAAPTRTTIMLDLRKARRATYTPCDGCKPSSSPNEESAMCVHCQFGLEPVRLRRRWVHHFRETGQIVVCESRNLKCS